MTRRPLPFATALAGAVLAAVTAMVAASAAAGAGAAAAAAAAAQVAEGRGLAAVLGCGGCHAGVPGGEGIRAVAPAFGDGAAPMAPAFVFHYMADPQAVRPDIAPARMPLYDLDERQRVALALFATNERELRGVDDALRAAMARHPDADRAEGAAVYEMMGCGGCHEHAEGGNRVAAAPDLGATGLRVRRAWLAGYLADPAVIRPAGAVPGRGGQMPDFRLDAGEVAALADYLMSLDGSGVGAPDGGPAGTGGRAGEAASSLAAARAWEPVALSPSAMSKSGALVRKQWSCLGCHALGGEGGRIGPGLDGIGRRLRPAWVRAMIVDPAHAVPGAIMPASLEAPERIDLMASFLLLRDGVWTGSEALAGMPALPRAGDADPGAESGAAAEPDPSAEPDPGAALYNARCAPCHGVGGGGDGFNARFLPVAPAAHSDSAAMSLRTDGVLYDGIFAGGRVLGRSHRMPAFGGSLDDGEKRALVAHIRRLCRCEGPGWSRDGRGG